MEKVGGHAPYLKKMKKRIAAEELEKQRQEERRALEEERKAMDKSNELEIRMWDALS